MVKVSVLIPVYNARNFLKDSVQSVLNQTFKDFELILLNDASTDDSVEIIKSFSDERIKYYKNDKNLGISGSRNRLLDLAKGEYLAIMDNDDLSMPTRFEKQVEFLDNNPDVGIVGTWGELFNNRPAEGFVNKIKKFITNMGLVWCHPFEATMKETLRANTCMHSSMMVRASTFKENNIRYNGELTPSEDYDLVRQVLEAGFRVCNLQEVLFKYNLHGGNFSLKTKQKMKDADKIIRSNIEKFLNYHPKFRYPYWLIIVRKLRYKPLLRWFKPW